VDEDASTAVDSSHGSDHLYGLDLRSSQAACRTAYFLLSIPGHSVVATIFLFTVAGVLTAYLSTFWAIPTEIMSHAEAATAVGVINAVGSVAGFAGPYIFGYVYIRTGASFSWGLRLVMTAVLIAGLMILQIPKAPKTATET
jgi:MFS transporter, ACS family, tartrate transporter